MTEEIETDGGHPAEDFAEDFPDEYADVVNSVSYASSSVLLKMEGDSVVAPGITEPLLREGWVITSHSGSTVGEKYYFDRIDTETEEVEVTRFEERTVAVTKDPAE